MTCGRIRRMDGVTQSRSIEARQAKLSSLLHSYASLKRCNNAEGAILT
jgi:hypothetical protein